MADAAFASQTLARGTGDLSGTMLGVTAGPSLTAQEVAAGHIVVFSGAHVGCYVITDVEASQRRRCWQRTASRSACVSTARRISCATIRCCAKSQARS